MASADAPTSPHTPLHLNQTALAQMHQCFRTLTCLTPSRSIANAPSFLVFLLIPLIRGAASFLSTLSPWLAFSYELILRLALKLGIYQSFSRYSSASSSKSQVRPSSSWNPSHNKARYLPRGHYSTNIQKMEYLLDASSRNITP